MGKSGTEFVLNNKRLLALFAVLILILGTFFIFGYQLGRSSAVNKGATPADTRKEFLDPECHIPLDASSRYLAGDLLNDSEDHPKPTEAQMTQIRPLLPKETRIFSLARVDVEPPIVFVLHQPQPRTSRYTQLTLFRFIKGGIDSEDLGSYCFIPNFLIDQKGRAFAGWAENIYGGNSWDSSVLKTIVLEKGEVSFPESEAESYQVAKELILDQGMAVLIALDTRYEFWEGFDHADSPIQQSIFELSRDGVWIEATSRHRHLVEEWIQDDLKILQEAKTSKDKEDIRSAALNLYLNAENAGQAGRYRKMVKQALKESGWDYINALIDQAARRKCRLIEIAGS
jgi:hypothetical protein